mgnify:FL=1
MEVETEKQKKISSYLQWAFLAMPIIAALDTLFPFLLKSIVNKQLQKLDDFKGKAEGIRISLFKQRITIKKVYIDKLNAETRQPSMFASIDELSIGYNWLQLWNKELDVRVKAQSPAIYFNPNRFQQLQKAKIDIDVPVRLEGVMIENGVFDFVDTSNSRPTAVTINNIHLEMVNVDEHTLKLATYMVSAKADVCNGKLDANFSIDLGNINPTFDMNLKLEGVQLVQLNSFLRTYAHFDVNSGNIDLYIEAKAKMGRFNGYIKPVISNLDVLGPEDRHESLGNRIWQGIVGFVLEILENQKHDQIATQIPFSGTFKNPKVNTAAAIFEVFSNGFIKAIRPSFDYSFDRKTKAPDTDI